MLFKKSSAPPLNEEMTPAGHDIPVRLRRNARARRLILRQDIKNGGFTLTLPKRASLTAAQRFINDQTEWLIKHNSHIAPPRRFTDGDKILYRGSDHLIVSRPDQTRGLITVTNTEIHIPGDPAHLHRRLCDFIKTECRAALAGRVREKAARIGKTVRRIRIADQSTRWGSCSSTGTLSFSCRLIFAPDFVIDYLAAHEVTHLREMNHSDRFWQLLYGICPETDRAEDWLKMNGAKLHRYR